MSRTAHFRTRNTKRLRLTSQGSINHKMQQNNWLLQHLLQCFHNLRWRSRHGFVACMPEEKRKDVPVASWVVKSQDNAKRYDCKVGQCKIKWDLRLNSTMAPSPVASDGAQSQHRVKLNKNCGLVGHLLYWSALLFKVVFPPTRQ